MRVHTTAFTLLFLATSVYAEEDWKIVKQEEVIHENVPFRMPKQTNIEFSNGTKFTTTIIEFKLLATLKTSENIPFLIFSGRDCTECDMNTSIYIHSPLIDNFSGEPRYSYPGKLSFYEDNSLLEESRMFYGQCLKEGKTSVIWYSNYLGKDNKWHKITYPVEFKGKTAEMTTGQFTDEALYKTFGFVKKGICFEITGTERTSEP